MARVPEFRVFLDTLHHGDTSDLGCTCTCGFCSNGACRTFLPFATAKSVHGMGVLSDLLLSEKVFLYRGEEANDVKAHRSTCVSGHCLTGQRRQAAFFGCPRHHVSTDRRVLASSAALGAMASTSEGQAGKPADDDDGDWATKVASDSPRTKKVNARYG
ncbi:unnamed protein product [Ectocarpus sp. CCAP 1310/34]|nr:unnamed protein product [Ectocarpus sp. CCAP 1310/34]